MRLSLRIDGRSYLGLLGDGDAGDEEFCDFCDSRSFDIARSLLDRIPESGVLPEPQAFDARTLLAAYERADADGFEGTDTASCVERYAPDVEIAAVTGSAGNLKVTYPEDVALADRLGQRG